MKKALAGGVGALLAAAAIAWFVLPHGKSAVPPPPAVVGAAQPASAPAVAARPQPSVTLHAAATAPVRSACDRFLRTLPNVSLRLCESASLVDSGARSVQGTPLYVRDVGDPKAQLRVLVIGAIHGDELSAATVAMHWIELAGVEKVDMPQPVHWRFVPVVNPDGLLAHPPKRVNADGVDLNRNFPTPNWERDAAVYWQQRTHKDPRRWPGPKPLSEPETRFVHAQMESFRPHLIVSIHAPFGVLDFDGPTVPPSRLGRLYLDQVGIYPGSLGNYGGVHKGVPVVTIELPNALRAPRDAEMRQMWIDLLRWMSAKIHAN